MTDPAPETRAEAVAARRARRRRAPTPEATPETPRTPMTVVHEDESLRIATLGDPSLPNAFVCFTGIGHAMGGLQMEEFVGSTRLPGFFAVFVTDRRRSWFNDFEPRAILDPIAPLLDGKTIVTIGNSMGGFGAVWITRHLPVETCIAFAAQFSVSPEVMPREQRWKRFTSRIAEWRVPSLADAFGPGTRYYTFNGGVDRFHWKLFTRGRSVRHYVLRGAGHNAARLLKRHGLLNRVIEVCVEGGDPLPIMREGGMEVMCRGERRRA